MSAGKSAFAVGVTASLLLCGQSWASDPVTILVKPETSFDARAADLARCATVVHNADEEDMPASDQPVAGVPAGDGGGGVGAVAGAAIAGLIIGLIEEGNANRRGQALCMYNLGYRQLLLTPEEAGAYVKLTPAKKNDWERGFLASAITARFEPLLQTKVPRLPAYDDGPRMSGGLKLDDLTLAAPDVHQTGVAMTGIATRTRTAVLVTPIQTKDGPVRVAADAGTVFHQVDYRPQKDPLLRMDGATWCGPVRQLSGNNVAKDFYCFTGRDNGYEVFRPTGQAWLAGPHGAGFTLPPYDQPIQLEERAADDLGPLDFAVKIDSVDSRSVTLRAQIAHDGKNVTLWVRRISYDPKGVAVLPLWDWRLVLTHGADHELKVALSQDGDGHDWRVGELQPFE